MFLLFLFFEVILLKEVEMSLAPLGEMSLARLPDDILIIITNNGHDDDLYVTIERVCKQFHRTIRQKLTRCMTGPSDIEWLLLYESLTDIYGMIHATNENLHIIQHRRFDQLRLCIEEPLAPANNAILKDIFKYAHTAELYNGKVSDGWKCNSIVSIEDNELLVKNDRGALETFIELFASEAQTLYVYTDNDIEILLTAKLPKVRKLIIMDSVDVDNIARLGDVVNFTELHARQYVAIHNNTPSSKGIQITEFHSYNVQSWMNIKAKAPFVKHLTLHSSSGYINANLNVEKTTVKYYYSDDAIPMTFLENAYENVMCGGCTSPIIYEVNGIQVSNSDPYDVTIDNLNEMRVYVMKLACEYFDDKAKYAEASYVARLVDM